MKFKTIFFLFNIIISFSFIFIFLFPLFLFGSVTYSTFFKNNWGALLVFILILLVFNTYFLKNFRLFSLLEAENWIELIKYLENKIYVKNKIKKNNIKMLLNAYLLTSNPEATLKLEKHLEQKKKSLVEFFSIQFGIPYLLNNKPDESEKFFGRLLASSATSNPNWIRWNYGLSLIQQNQLEVGQEQFMKLLEEDKDLILYLLTLYILKSFVPSNPDLKDKIEAGIHKITGKYNVYTWQKLVETQKSNVQVLVLSRIIDQATSWLFGYLESKDLEFDAEPEIIN